MGDILDDSKMVNEQAHDVILRIGFFNKKEESQELIENYLRTFDVVITHDGTLHPVVSILNDLL